MRASAPTAAGFAQPQHSDLGGVGATDHHSNANDPSADQKAALAGTNGTPSTTNKYVTNTDPRLTGEEASDEIFGLIAAEVADRQSEDERVVDASISALAAESAIINRRIEANYADLASMATSLTASAEATLQSEIAQASDAANSLLAAEVAELVDRIDANYAELASLAESLAAAATTSLQGDLEQVTDAANSALAAEVSAINARIRANYIELASLAESLVVSAGAAVQSEIEQATDSANSALEASAAVINARIRANYTELASLAESLAASSESALQGEITQTADAISSAFAASDAEVKALVRANYQELASLAASLLASAEAALQAEIEQATDSATSALEASAAVINDRIDTNYTELASLAESLTASAEAALQVEIAQIADATDAALAAESTLLNSRIGVVHKIGTTNATPTILAALTPSPYRLVKVIAKIQGCRSDRLQVAAYTLEALARAVPSSSVLTLGGNVTADDQVEIDSVIYTFKAAVAIAYEVLRGGTAEASIDNLVKAINLTGTAGVEYGAGTAKHPSVSAVKASAATMAAVARVPGLAGDAITTTDPVDFGGVLAWTGVVLAGGSDMSIFGGTVTVDYEDDAAWVVAVAAVGTDVNISVTGVLGLDINWLAEVRTVELV
jgi:hypothetical protein